MGKFKTGDLIWAKMKNSTPWPARVISFDGKRKKYFVYFYGTDNYGWIHSTNIQSYFDGSYNVKRNLNNSSYRNAVKEVNAIYHELQLKEMNKKVTSEDDEDWHQKILKGLKLSKDKQRRVRPQENFVVTASGDTHKVSPSSSYIITEKSLSFLNSYIVLHRVDETSPEPNDHAEEPSCSSAVQQLPVLSRKCYVRLERFDEGLPKLSPYSEKPSCGSEEDNPPVLIPK